MSEEQEVKNAVEIAGYMRKSRFAWLWYFIMRALMFVEGIEWTAMDLTRALRMRVAARINRNYQRFNNK